jgi:hypothetical protein
VSGSEHSRVGVVPLLCGKYVRSPDWAWMNASSRSPPNENPTVMFWFLARCGLNAAESWWNGFQSLSSRSEHQNGGRARDEPQQRDDELRCFSRVMM